MRQLSLLIGLSLLAAACTPSLPEIVRIQGFIVEGPGEPANQQFVADATATVFDRSATNQLGMAVTDSTGFFVVGGLPPAEAVVLIVGKPDDADPHPYGVFTGFTENVDLSLFIGAVYTQQLPDALADVAEYAAAPGAPTVLDDFTIDFDTPDNGGMILGRVGRWVQAEFGLLFETVAGAEVTVTTGATSHPVCYRAAPLPTENEGPADCTVTSTATDSRFGVFGLPEGPVQIDVTHPEFGLIGDDTIIVEDGVTYLDFFALAFP